MKKWFIVFFSLFAFVLSSAHAGPKNKFKEDKVWAFITANAEVDYVVYGKRDSLVQTNNDAGEPIAMATFRIHSGKNIMYERRYVKISDCIRGQGNLVAVDLNGVYLFENQFILDGQDTTVKDAIATRICYPVLNPNQPSSKSNNKEA